jgi:glycosyltransferase involved in cell wall biosynthesis
MQRVDRFIAVSNFTRSKMIEAGLPAEKVDVKPNFLSAVPPIPGTGAGGYFVYVGRLSEEKGIRTLLNAWKGLPAPAPRLKFVGTGPLHDLVKSASMSMPQVEVLGARDADEVLGIVGRATALIFPSEWYEGHPRVMIEALAVGTPVIASDIGAGAEIVEVGVTGFRFRSGSATDLAIKIQDFVSNPDRIAAMRSAARETFLAHYTAADNIKLLLGTYERALAHAARARRAD